MSFDASFDATSSFYYVIYDEVNGDFEVGEGSLPSTSTLQRDTVITSSNAGALVDFVAGTKTVFVTAPAAKLPQIDPSGAFTLAANLVPSVTATYDLGSASLRWQDIYTSDLNLSNGIGDYTIVEGEDDLFLYNNKSNRVFKFALIEVDRNDAPPKIKDIP